LLGEEDVLCFQIPVQHILAVHMLQRKQHLRKPAQHLQRAQQQTAQQLLIWLGSCLL
jgi:hypothetical protein